MKKYIFTITILLSSFTMIAYAQKTSVGIQGGGTFSNYTMATDEESESGKFDGPNWKFRVSSGLTERL